jgi:PAS domain S-box-containing protein
MIGTLHNQAAQNQTHHQENGNSHADYEGIIRKISSSIHSSLNTDKILQTIVDEVGKALSACRVRLALLDDPLPVEIPITHQYEGSCCAAKPSPRQAIIASHNTAFELVINADEPIAINDIDTDELLGTQKEKYRIAGVQAFLSTAIRLNGKPIGVFGVHLCHKHQWSAQQIAIVAAVAEQAALAIRQAELYREAAEAATRANLLNQIVTSMRRSLNIDEILQVAVDELGRALSVNRTYIRKFVGDNGQIVAQHLSAPELTVPNVTTRSKGYLLNHLLTRQLIKTRRSVIIDNLDDFLLENLREQDGGIMRQMNPPNKSQISCPIFINEAFWGVLSIAQTDRNRKWTKNDIVLVEEVTAQLEIAISHSQLYEEAQQAAKVESLIRRLTESLNQSNRTHEIYHIVAQELGKHLAVDALMIFSIDLESNDWQVECAYSQGQPLQSSMMRVNFAELLPFIPIIKEDVVILNDLDHNTDLLPYRERFPRLAEVKAYASVKMSYKEQAKIGIGIISKSELKQWTTQDINILKATINQMGIALERAELFEQIWRGKIEWEKTFDALTDGLLIFDRNGILRRVNTVGVKLEGIPDSEMLGRKCCSLLTGLDGKDCKVSQVLETGESITFELTPEKLSRPVLITISPLTEPDKSGDGSHFQSPDDGARQTIMGAVCIIRDLTDLRAAQASARQQKNFLAQLIEHANESIFALSRDGNLIWVNEQSLKVSGCTFEQLSGTGYVNFIVRDDVPAARKAFQQALTGEASTVELRALNCFHQETSLLVTCTPIFDEQDVTHVLLIARDITEQKLVNERTAQDEKMRALGHLSAGIAHNFNNLLAAILGNAQLLKRSSSNEKLLKQAGVIERAALDGAEMVKRIQAFANQQKEVAYEQLQLSHILKDSITLTQPIWQDEARAKGVKYEVGIELSDASIIRGAASEIREVFVNIILNALDAMPEGGTLHISSKVSDGFAITSFSDTGCGMSEEVRQHIFEPFFTTKGVAGTGLGLAVSYTTIERHGGTIDVVSESGQGSTFSIKLPVVGTCEAIFDPKRDVMTNRPNKKLRILVIEDDDRVRDVVTEILRISGHRVEAAMNGTQALERLEKSEFDLVLTDLSMPDIDGWAVATAVRQRWKNSKVILLTGYGSQIDNIEEHKNLIDGILAKPISMDDLNKTINDLQI